MSLRKTISLFYVIWVCSISFAQTSNLGIPPIFNYNKKQHKGGTQTWDIIKDDFGYSWFANNSGLLRYDGYSWDVFRLPNNTIIRSIAINNKDGRIYIGSQGELGYFESNEKGELAYKSLIHKISGFVIEEVWDVFIKDNVVFFRTDNEVFRYKNDTLECVFKLKFSLNFMGIWGDELVVQSSDNKLYTYKNDKFQLKSFPYSFDKGRISSVINFDNSILITTINNGIFKETPNGFEEWRTNADDILKKDIIFCATKNNQDQLIIGTILNGLIIIGKNHQLITVINKQNGLQNNSILSVFCNNSGDIWLGLDNGIDYVNLSTSFKTFYPDENLQGTGYVSFLHQNKLYCGTNSGLYSIDWSSFSNTTQNSGFKLIPNTLGQVWNINSIGNEIYLGHHNAGFKIENSNASLVTKTQGVWKFLQLNDTFMIAGTYKGFIYFTKKNNSWEFRSTIDGIKESCRIFYTDKYGNILLSHPYRGIFFIKNSDFLSKKINPITLKMLTKNNKPLNNQVYKIGDEILLTDNINLYSFDSEKFTLKEYKFLEEYIDPKDNIKFLLEDDFKNVWFGTNVETGLLIPEKSFNKNYKKYIINYLNNKLTEGFQSVFSIDRNNVIIPTDKGFVHFNPEKYISDTFDIHFVLSKVILKTPKDSILYIGNNFNQAQSYTFSFQPNEKSLLFQFSAKENPKELEFSYLIEGRSQHWSDWSSSPYFNFSNIANGEHVFQFKARNQNGKVSNTIKIKVTINPPFYKSNFAYLFYILSFIGFGIFINLLQRKKHKKETLYLQKINELQVQEHQLKEELSIEKINQLQNEKLKAELDLKNQELTSFTYHLVNKNELINQIQKIISKLDDKFGDNSDIHKELKNILRMTENDTNIDEDWENFVKSFDQVHSNFFKRLNENFNNLSPNDYKMCIYLRLNMTSKEIATLMNISIRSVETNRYRLRKKLGLDPNENLTQFLLKY